MKKILAVTLALVFALCGIGFAETSMFGVPIPDEDSVQFSVLYDILHAAVDEYKTRPISTIEDDTVLSENGITTFGLITKGNYNLVVLSGENAAGESRTCKYLYRLAEYPSELLIQIADWYESLSEYCREGETFMIWICTDDTNIGISTTEDAELLRTLLATGGVATFGLPSSGSTGSAPTQKPVSVPTPRPATTGERNALEKAHIYLSIMPFSYSGLVEQLEYEGYTHSEATYAADHCGADWYEQAAKKAQDYLDIMSFSRSGLIDQLEYEGFTYEQAVYGVNQVY